MKDLKEINEILKKYLDVQDKSNSNDCETEEKSRDHTSAMNNELDDEVIVLDSSDDDLLFSDVNSSNIQLRQSFDESKKVNDSDSTDEDLPVNSTPDITKRENPSDHKIQINIQHEIFHNVILKRPLDESKGAKDSDISDMKLPSTSKLNTIILQRSLGDLMKASSKINSTVLKRSFEELSEAKDSDLTDEDMPSTSTKINSSVLKQAFEELNKAENSDSENDDMPSTSKNINSRVCKRVFGESKKAEDRENMPSPSKKLKSNLPINNDVVNEEKKENQSKKIDKQKDKENKRIVKTVNKAYKPEEYLKNLTVNIDPKVLEEKYGSEIINTLQDNKISYKIYRQLLPSVVTWTKLVQSQITDKEGQLKLTSEKADESQVVIFLKFPEFLTFLISKSYVSHVKRLTNIFVQKQIIIAIIGLEHYHKLQQNRINQKLRADIKGKSINNRNENNSGLADDFTRKQVDEIIMEAEILYRCQHAFVETPTDCALLIFRLTKSISQIPYILQKYAEDDSHRNYISGENKNSVNVDDNGNGLHSLWSQQLTKFPKAGLGAAEAITAVYPTPRQLIQAYDRCKSEEEKAKLLKELPIRRAAGPLINEKRLGPELSKKVYKFFNSRNGDDFIS